MKVVVDVLGRTAPMDLRIDGNEARFQLGDDDERAANLIEVERGVYSVTMNGRSFDVRVSGKTMMLCGYAIDVEVRDPREMAASAGAGAGHGKLEIVSPMPGKVVRILVAVGDSVEAGQGLIVVEAMKMQNEMKAPKAGVILEIKAVEGSTVAAGEVLAVIE